MRERGTKVARGGAHQVEAEPIFSHSNQEVGREGRTKEYFGKSQEMTKNNEKTVTYAGISCRAPFFGRLCRFLAIQVTAAHAALGCDEGGSERE